MTTPAQVAHIMPPLPETPYQLYYEWPDDEDGYGGSEVVDGDAYTAEQMKAYARAAVETALRDAPPQASQPLTDEQIKRHSLLAADCPGASTVILVSSLRRLLAAAPTEAKPAPDGVCEALECGNHGAEPVAYSVTCNGRHVGNVFSNQEKAAEFMREMNRRYPQESRSVVTFFAPPQASQPLTDDEIDQMWREATIKPALTSEFVRTFARAIEQAHGIGAAQKGKP